MAKKPIVRQGRAARSASTTGPAGTKLRARGPNGPQIIKTEGRSWSDEAEAIFLENLAATCNVKRSAQASGFSVKTVYNHRSNDAGFAERWRLALAQGYVRLETALVRAATDTMEGVPFETDAPIPPMSVSEAMNLLQLHRAGAAEYRKRRGGGTPCRPRTLDDIRGAILTKLEAIIAMSDEEAEKLDAA